MGEERVEVVVVYHEQCERCGKQVSRLSAGRGRVNEDAERAAGACSLPHSQRLPFFCTPLAFPIILVSGRRLDINAQKDRILLAESSKRFLR